MLFQIIAPISFGVPTTRGIYDIDSIGYNYLKILGTIKPNKSSVNIIKQKHTP